MSARDSAARFDPVEDAMGILRRNAEEIDARPVTRPPLQERALARVIDIIGLGVLLFIVLGVRHALTVNGEPGLTTNQWPNTEGVDLIAWGPVPITAGFIVDIAIIFACLVAYEVITTLFFGQTPGKRWTGIRIVDTAEGDPARLGPLLARTAIWALPAALVIGCWFLSLTYGWLSLAVLVALAVRTARDTDERGPHERASGTLLVNEARRREQAAQLG